MGMRVSLVGPNDENKSQRHDQEGTNIGGHFLLRGRVAGFSHPVPTFNPAKGLQYAWKNPFIDIVDCFRIFDIAQTRMQHLQPERKRVTMHIVDEAKNQVESTREWGLRDSLHAALEL